MQAARRRLLAASLALPFCRSSLSWAAGVARGRVVVVGGGWGGLAAARRLRELAPQMDVVLLEKAPGFFSLPLSTKWLAGQIDVRLLQRDYAAAAARFGYRLVRTEVSEIDRAARTVITRDGRHDYDWLVLAAGIRHDYAAWFGGDAEAARQAGQRYSCAYRPDDDFASFKARIEGFSGGTLLMNVPAGQYRCPPAPYERAVWIAQLIKQKRIKGRLLLIDPGSGPLGFRQLFADRYADQITHVTHAAIKSVDPFARRLETEFDEFRFDDAILMPPQQAADLVWRAGLISREADGKPSGWADLHPLRLHAVGDERVFLVGDLIGKVSPLFGYYSKSGHVAARLGRIAAAQIVAQAGGDAAPIALPDNVCYVQSDLDPPQSLRIDTRYRLRGDGVISQEVRQTRDPQPRGEDEAWLAEQLGELLGPG